MSKGTTTTASPFDAANRLLSVAQNGASASAVTSDADGNTLTDTSGRTMTWGSQSRMVSGSCHVLVKCPFVERSSWSAPHISFRLFLRPTNYLEIKSKFKLTLLDKDCWMLEGNRAVQAEIPVQVEFGSIRSGTHCGHGDFIGGTW